MAPPFSSDRTIAALVREEWGRILAALTKALGDLQLAEDCLQEAVSRALVRWPETGIPDSPAAWLIRTARNAAIDRIRRETHFAAALPELTLLAETAADAADPEAIPDKRLEMIFTCCHPALEEKTRIALTLRTLGGLSTEEIAASFLDTPEAMAQRLVRAKRKIREARIPYRVPQDADLPARMQAVLVVVYLIFAQGHGATTPKAAQLSAEAIRLGRILHGLRPDDPEVAGLLALMLLTDARKAGRTDAKGGFLPLQHQNRRRWDRARCAEGDALLRRTLSRGRIGPYQLQAAISACHATSPTWEATDWSEIAALYALLSQMTPTPVVRLNHAVALSYCGKLAEALGRVAALQDDPAMRDYQPFHAAFADLAARAGDIPLARTHYARAIALSSSQVERLFLHKASDSLGP
ncbi:RNA polymerase sigma factor [Yoonia sp.]|uniref:RNA polymerase sigma factor n=1 Tax=Yoonia sp. TaxID=2212373 RepID=UPI002FDA0D28